MRVKKYLCNRRNYSRKESSYLQRVLIEVVRLLFSHMIRIEFTILLLTSPRTIYLSMIFALLQYWLNLSFYRFHFLFIIQLLSFNMFYGNIQHFMWIRHTVEIYRLLNIYKVSANCCCVVSIISWWMFLSLPASSGAIYWLDLLRLYLFILILEALYTFIFVKK